MMNKKEARMVFLYFWEKDAQNGHTQMSQVRGATVDSFYDGVLKVTPDSPQVREQLMEIARNTKGELFTPLPPHTYKRPYKRSYAGVEARIMRPTKRHRPVMWEGILGTVYACSPEGEVKYFDYDWKGAAEFCGVLADGADPRVVKLTYEARCKVQGYAHPTVGRQVLWATHTPTN